MTIAEFFDAYEDIYVHPSWRYRLRSRVRPVWWLRGFLRSIPIAGNDVGWAQPPRSYGHFSVGMLIRNEATSETMRLESVLPHVAGGATWRTSRGEVTVA